MKKCEMNRGTTNSQLFKKLDEEHPDACWIYQTFAPTPSPLQHLHIPQMRLAESIQHRRILGFVCEILGVERDRGPVAGFHAVFAFENNRKESALWPAGQACDTDRPVSGHGAKAVFTGIYGPREKSST